MDIVRNIIRLVLGRVVRVVALVRVSVMCAHPMLVVAVLR